jgi:transposase
VLGISRSCIYDWLRWYRAEGEAALETVEKPYFLSCCSSGRWQ